MEPETVCEETRGKDHRPEYCQYRDEGCELSGSCLQCPYARCIYENPQGKKRLLKALRDEKICASYRDGKNPKELALMFGVSVRTVQRVLRTYKTRKVLES